MDEEMRQSLGGVIVGAVLVVVGLLAQLSPAYTLNVLGAVAIWGGGILIVVLALKTAAQLMRREKTPS